MGIERNSRLDYRSNSVLRDMPSTPREDLLGMTGIPSIPTEDLLDMTSIPAEILLDLSRNPAGDLLDATGTASRTSKTDLQNILPESW